MSDSENLSPTLVNMVLELRRVVEVEVRSEVARRMAGENMPAADIAACLGVSRQTVYRYLKRENGSTAEARANGHVAEDAGQPPSDMERDG